MKKFIRIFTAVFVSALLMALVSSNKASAVTGTFDTNKNNTNLTVYTKESHLMLKVEVTFTRGFSQEKAMFAVCEVNPGEVITSITDCGFTDASWKGYAVTGDINTFSDKATGVDADANPTTKTYEVDTGIIISSENTETSYIIYVKTFFCSVRVLDANGHYTGGSGGEKCLYWHNPGEGNMYNKIEFKGKDVRDTNITQIEDEQLQSMMDKVTDIVNTIVLPVIWGALGLFLIVKGSLLGFQIVKAADEPQVRQEKIGALKWLVIGVAIAYAASGLVRVVTGVLSGAFNFS